jgi:hypothetical protein
MRRLLTIALTFLVLIAFCLPVAAQAQASGKSKYEVQMYHIVVFKKGPNWKPFGTPELDVMMGKFVENLRKAEETGLLVAAGLVNDNTDVEMMFILNIENLYEAMELARNSMMVKNGQYTPVVHSWLGPKGLKPDPPRSN